METKKICPLLKAGFFANADVNQSPACNCIGRECALWVPAVYTTEDISWDNDGKGFCSFFISALKNSEGKIPV